MKYWILFLFAGFILSYCAYRNRMVIEKDPELLKTIDQNFRDAAVQYKVMMKMLPEGRFPKTYDPASGELQTSGSQWWCSGFYPGSLLFIYEQTGDSVLFNEAVRIMGILEKEKHNKGTHDLGFMMFCSFGHLNRIQPDKKYDSILMTSARSLATRFNPVVGCIRSWNSAPEDFLVIIDNMMNLKLLFWATRNSGDSSFYHKAITHANSTLQNHFRTDHSSYHVVNYDPVTGTVRQKRTAQGYSDESAWSRGQAWGLYGYTETYRLTGDNKYLEQAKKIARFLLDHPNLPKDKIPYWDFNAPDIPDALRDASAASIMAAALLELSTYTDKNESRRFFITAETILKTLSSPQYKSAQGTNGGFLLLHGVGHLPQKSEVDVPLTYADYYFLEAMVRYKNYSGMK